MRPRVSELHADWLQLVEPHGQFLSLPILKRVFPNGLDAIDESVRDQVRGRFPKGEDPKQPDWNAWLDWLLRDVLRWGTYYVTGNEAATFAHAVPEHGVTIRADGALLDPETSKPRVLVVRYSHGTEFTKRTVGDRWNTSPLDRLALLCRAHDVCIGMMSDGERITVAWIPETGTGGSATWETGLFTESKERNLFQSFVSLFEARRFFSVGDGQQLEALFKDSAKAQNELTDQLGFQVRKAVELLVTSISQADLEQRGSLLKTVAPQTVYEAAVTVMMRLVFLLYAEERDLLPLGDPLYAEHYSASTLLEQLEEQASLEGDEPLERRSAAWFRLLATFRAIYAGVSHDRLRLMAYGGRLFDPDRFPFLEGRSKEASWRDVIGRPLPVDDLTVKAILEAIQTLPIREVGGRERRRLSFSALDVEQIGHVYEGLLDHNAVRAAEVHVGLVGKSGDEAEIPLAQIEEAAAQGTEHLVLFLAETTGKSETTIAKTLERGRALVGGNDPEMRRLVKTVCETDRALEPRILPYAYLLRADLHGLPVVFAAQSLVVKKTRERRDSGTEYTPRELAEEVVRHALDALVYSPGPRDGVDSNQWKIRSSRELLELKICDPACGSGAFLVSACRYLADRVVEAWLTENAETLRADRDDLTLEAARLVAERCLYGVDRDGMAVEMAKLSLWLTTMTRERPFSFLDHAIREGDSLLGVSSLDQLRYLHVDPIAGRRIHAKALVDVTEAIKPLVDESARLRRELEVLPSLTARDADEKRRLNDKAENALKIVATIADSIIATALSTANETNAKKRDSAFQGLGVRVQTILKPASPEKQLETLSELKALSGRLLNSGRPHDGPPRITFHWPLVFSEVFTRGEGRGFDAIVGNPPFVGGKKVSGAFGSDFREFLISNIAGGRKGNADLVSYFFLRAAQLSSTFGFLAVNTIAQGDTREVGLDALVADGWQIVRATKSKPWPGNAGVHIAQVWLSWPATQQKAILDDLRVKGISPLLMPLRRLEGNPARLEANAGIAFNGSYALGMGFTMLPEQAARLIHNDPRNADVLFPYLNADDLCTRPDCSPSRWIIDFHDWELEKAEEYTDCMTIVRTKVKPQRDKVKDAYGRKYWWRLMRTRPALRRAIGERKSVIVMPLVSKVVLPVMYAANMVFSHRVAVVARDDRDIFGILSSTIHRDWARRYSSTLGTTTNYAPSDCFETFPFPFPSCGTEVSNVIDQLDRCRSKIMLDVDIGLTSLYNRVNDEEDADSRIGELRALHADLDRAVCDAYGWTDLELRYGFHSTEESIRWTICEEARSEILDRLLELNRDRHQQEAGQNPISDGRASINLQKRGKKSAAPETSQLALIGDHE